MKDLHLSILLVKPCLSMSIYRGTQPVRLNGILQENFVQCLLEDGSVMVFNESVLSDVTFLVLSSLSLTPHTTYLVSITSTTGGGSSETNISVLSPEAGGCGQALPFVVVPEKQ